MDNIEKDSYNDTEKAADYIKYKLNKKGIIIGKDLIINILELEGEYLLEKSNL